MKDCVFCKIVSGDLKTEKLYEDSDMIIIKDINPEAQIHLLLIPKIHFENISNINKENSQLFGKCIYKIGEIFKSLGLSDGYRIIVNNGKNACQSVMHTHIHIIGGEKLPSKII